MPEPTSYEEGTPSWVDLSSPDVDGSKRFYGELFGWEAVESGPVEETGGYGFFLQDGKRVAGVGGIMSEDQPPVWSTYFATDDVDALAAKVSEAGGTALMEPMDVMDAGRMAFFAHPSGGMFGAWQAGNHTGAEIVKEPVSLTWNTLLTRDVEGGTKFLGEVFGLEAQPTDGPMTLLKLGENGVAGVMDMPPSVPDEVPAYWGVTFAVADTDATVAKAQELGAGVLMPPSPMPGLGRLAIMVDPFGSQFAVAALDA